MSGESNLEAVARCWTCGMVLPAADMASHTPQCEFNRRIRIRALAYKILALVLVETNEEPVRQQAIMEARDLLAKL